jgi:hypothetical protein
LGIPIVESRIGDGVLGQGDVGQTYKYGNEGIVVFSHWACLRSDFNNTNLLIQHKAPEYLCFHNIQGLRKSV